MAIRVGPEIGARFVVMPRALEHRRDVLGEIYIVETPVILADWGDREAEGVLVGREDMIGARAD